jgi:hypothetical protein
MREGIETVAEAIVRRWSRERTVELRASELALVRAYLRRAGVTVHELPGGRFEVENAGTRQACGAAQLLLVSLRRLVAERRATAPR